MILSFLFLKIWGKEESETILQNHQKVKFTQDTSTNSTKFPYGIVSDYSFDNKNQNEFYKLLVLGNNIQRMIPHVDRILLIPTNFYVSNSNINLLNQAWNVILRLNYPQFHCYTNIQSQDINHEWFRFQSFSLKMYKKLLYVDHNTIFVNNPDMIFSYPVPSAPNDYQSFGITYFGIAHNYRFLLFEPNTDIYYRVLNQTCNWLDNPNNHQYKYDSYSTVSIGPYDNGVLHEIYGIDTNTMPFYSNVFVGQGKLQNKIQYTDPHIVSFAFHENDQPWNGFSIPDLFWKEIAEQAFNYLDIASPFKLKPRPEDKKIHDYIKSRLKFVQYPIYKLVECDSEFVSFSSTSVIIKSCCLLFFGLGIISVLKKMSYLYER